MYNGFISSREFQDLIIYAVMEQEKGTNPEIILNNIISDGQRFLNKENRDNWRPVSQGFTEKRLKQPIDEFFKNK